KGAVVVVHLQAAVAAVDGKPVDVQRGAVVGEFDGAGASRQVADRGVRDTGGTGQGERQRAGRDGGAVKATASDGLASLQQDRIGRHHAAQDGLICLQRSLPTGRHAGAADGQNSSATEERRVAGG